MWQEDGHLATLEYIEHGKQKSHKGFWEDWNHNQNQTWSIDWVKNRPVLLFNVNTRQQEVTSSAQT